LERGKLIYPAVKGKALQKVRPHSPVLYGHQRSANVGSSPHDSKRGRGTIFGVRGDQQSFGPIKNNRKKKRAPVIPAVAQNC